MAEGVVPPRVGNMAVSNAPGAGTFPTAEGLLCLGANKLSHLVSLSDELGLDVDDAIDAVRFREEIAGVLLADTAANWELRLSARRVPAARGER